MVGLYFPGALPYNGRVNFVAQTGARAIGRVRGLLYLLATAAGVAAAAAQPRHWRATVRDVLARQILFTGVDAVRFVSLIAFLVGVSVVAQAQLWLGRVGQSALLGPLLITVVVRELAPLLTNFVIIGRSGTAIATELGNMQIHGEVHVLDAQGLDPFLYLVLPRVVGMAVSVFCLTVLFSGVALAGGYLVGLLIGVTNMAPLQFADTVLAGVQQADVWNLLAKTLVPGLLTGSICCLEGLGVGGSVTEVPQAATRAVVRSTTALFLTSALVSVVTYV